jgi:hypothetical protein
VSKRRRRQLPSGVGYPRVCAECGRGFTARRRTARWCSDKCRLRAWRHATRATDNAEIDRLRQQVAQLRAALQSVQDDGICSTAGCQQLPPPRQKTATAAALGVWRDPDWNGAAARTLRTTLTQTLQEVERLRDENTLMRRWITEHRDHRDHPGTGS